MKEQPILFSSEMVKTILDGRKTQTRRVIKPQPNSGVRQSPFVKSGLEDGHGREIKCPYGQPGDLLWVKETWNGTQGEGVAYRATNPEMNGEPWKSSRFMPRWASRITLEIVNIRVERLQEIKPLDAVAEGMDPDRHSVIEFRNLWNAINGKRGYGWDINPWVWVIEFPPQRACIIRKLVLY